MAIRSPSQKIGRLITADLESWLPADLLLVDEVWLLARPLRPFEHRDGLSCGPVRYSGL